jgi:surface polysaccharide O-acyltransferase-like enzyme
MDRDETARRSLVYQLPVLKGVAVLAVVLTHASSSIWRPFAWPVVPEVFVNTLARFAVPLFLVLSGFYLSLNTRNEKPLRFYRRALPGLLWPYVVYTALYGAVRAPDARAFVASLPEYLRHGSASSHLWFIPVIVELYVLHPWLRRAYVRLRQPVVFVGGAFVFQAAYLFTYELALRPAGPFTGWADLVVSVTAFLKFVGFFVAGYALRDHAAAFVESSRERFSLEVALTVWLSTGMLLPVLWLSRGIPGHGVSPTWLSASRIALELLTVPLTGAVLTLLAARKARWRVPMPLRWVVTTCGLYGYGVYYLHPFVMQMAARMFYAYARPLMTPGPQRAVLMFVTGTFVTIAVVKVLVRLPLTRRLA